MNPDGLDCCASEDEPGRILLGFVGSGPLVPEDVWKGCVGDTACFPCCAPAVAGAFGPEVPGNPNAGLLKGRPS